MNNSKHFNYYVIIFILSYLKTQTGVEVGGSILNFDHIIARFKNDAMPDFIGKFYSNNPEMYQSDYTR